ncbi:hypothetical protein MHK_004867, partial [Candidatus Magnetomorum sp. HK-1]
MRTYYKIINTNLPINVDISFQNYIGRNAEIIILIENTSELKSHFVFDDEKSTKKGITAKDILLLPIDKRESVIAKQFKDAIELYDDNPELILSRLLIHM